MSASASLSLNARFARLLNAPRLSNRRFATLKKRYSISKRDVHKKCTLPVHHFGVHFELCGIHMENAVFGFRMEDPCRVAPPVADIYLTDHDAHIPFSRREAFAFNQPFPPPRDCIYFVPRQARALNSISESLCSTTIESRLNIA